ESQSSSAQRMYSARAPTYNATWHPSYSARFVSLAPLVPGHRVLDLCCGTGGDALLAADAVGAEGQVVAVDITQGMLDQEQEEKRTAKLLKDRVAVFRHDVTDLDGPDMLAKGSFDVLLCSTAFVLLQNPEQVVAHWMDYLRPGGAMVIDIPHEHNLRAGSVLEKVVKEHLDPHQKGAGFPGNRAWVESRESFCRLLEGAGMRVEAVHVLEDITGHGTRYYDVEEAESVLAKLVEESSLTAGTTLPEGFREKLGPLFVEAWKDAAVDGKVEDVDVLYVYVARK
ncbi:S-adenosyl-L-methionine-dependent methyltransferase, partial [Coniella lustricola]